MSNAFTITDARYAKKMRAVHCVSSGDGMKTRAMCLADAIARGRYSGRENAYIMSRAAADRFVRLYHAGFSANFISRELIPPANKQGGKHASS